MNPFEQTLELGDYWRFVVRRKWLFCIVFGIVFGAAVALAFLLPAIFRSESTILIERQAIPSNLVATTVTGYVQEQIGLTRQRIATHENLLEIAEKYYLYPEQIESDPASVAQAMRENFEVAMQDVRAADPDVAGVRVATIAFNVSFESESPEVSRDVTNELTQRFLDDHKRAREARAAEVTDFLDEEAERMRLEIADLEKSLADFKQEELRQLPELLNTNLRLFEKTEQDIEATEQRIRGISDRLEAVRAELSLTPAYEEVRTESGKVILSAEQRLSVLTSQYLQATARYSAKHPDVIRLSREIRILAEQSGTGARADELMNELVALQDQLRDARQRYSDDHPEVQRLERAVAAVQRGFETAIISGEEKALTMPPDNPRYVALKTQETTLKGNLAEERERLETLNSKLTEYEQRLFQTPVVERDFKSLARDYENATKKYRELREKQLQARMAEELESGGNAERWTLASPAFLPTLPESPNRMGIMLLGFLFATLVAMGAVVLREYFDKTVRSARVVMATLGAPPLAVIPQMSAARRISK